jgi:capsular polysaccharide biosynthesis protein
LLKLIAKWRFHLLVIVGVAAIFAAIFSGPTFITPMYKSYAVSYPANVEPYSEESTTEQMLQILNSQDIVDSVVQKFDLFAHYEIDPDFEYAKTILLYEYHQNVHISKTPFESVLIEVHDKDPVVARDIVNSIMDFYNKKISRLHKSKYVEVVDMYSGQLRRKKAVLDSLKQVLYVLGTEYGLIEYSAQTQEIMRGYLKTVYGNNSRDINTKEVKRLLDNMEIKGGQLIEIVQMIQDESRTYVEVKLDYEMNVRFLNANMTYANIVTSPFVADKKSYPVRWIIVVVASLAAFVFALLIILFLDSRKKS